MLKRIGLVAATLLIILGIVIATRPSTFEISRAVFIKAPKSVVYAQVASFPNWVAWSPWEGRDPAMARTYSGAPSGKGAHYEWRGDNKAGAGSMTITDEMPNEHLGIDLDIVEPSQGHHRIDFDFVQKDETTTEVKWQMSGKSGFAQKAIGLLVNLDEMIGGDFEKGLAKLRTVSEEAAAPDAGDGAL